MKFDVRYYLMAIMFILFDLETGAFVSLGGCAHEEVGLLLGF